MGRFVVGIGLLLGLSSQKGGGRCGRMADEPWNVFWESPCSTEPDYFGNLSFQPKIFRSKLLIIKVSNPKAWPFMFHRQNRRKYFV